MTQSYLICRPLFRVLVAGIFLLGAFAWAAPSAKPNIVILFIDDMGYGDIGPFGNQVNQTPHLDRMAEEGIKFTQFYVANTACTPSRSALLTGTYAHRIGMDGGNGNLAVTFPGDSRGLNPNEITIAEMLRENGYATGCFGTENPSIGWLITGRKLKNFMTSSRISVRQPTSRKSIRKNWKSSEP